VIAHGKGGSNNSMTPALNRRLGTMAKRRPASKRGCNGTTASSMPGVDPEKGGSSGYHSIDTLSLSLSNFVVMVLFHAAASTRTWVSDSGIYQLTGPTLCESTQGGVIGDGTPNDQRSPWAMAIPGATLDNLHLHGEKTTVYDPTHQEARGAAPKTHGRGRSYVCPPLGADPATPFKSATYGQIKGVRSWGDFAPMEELYIQ
jgi:hypothetical protein